MVITLGSVGASEPPSHVMSNKFRYVRHDASRLEPEIVLPVKK